MRTLFLFVILCASTSPVFAQDSLLTGALPDSIVITATRYRTPARDAGQRIVVINAEDIRRLPVSSIDELLRSAGGVEVFSRGGFGVQSDITIRGGTFNGVLLLIDGARFNDAQTGHFLSDFPVPLSQIERIEIMRGPATVAYGPDAVNGVVHIITRGAANTSAAEGVQVSAGSRLGSHGFKAFESDLTYKANNWQTGGALVYQDSNGETIHDENGAVIGPRGVVTTDFNRLASTLFMQGKAGTLHVFGRLAADWRDFNAYRFYTVSSLDFSRENTRTLWGQLQLSKQFSASTELALHLVSKSHKDVFDFNPQFTANRHTSRHVVTRLDFRHLVSEQFSLNAGGEAWQRAIESNNLGNHDDITWATYAHAHLKPAQALSIYGGLRLDHNTMFGTEITPQFNAAYQLANVGFRANVGRAVRAPNYVEQYINTTRPPQRDRNYGNPDLSPEKAWSQEIGLDVYPVDDLSIHATFFHRNTANLIDFVRLDRNIQFPTVADSVLLAQNVSTVNTSGFETDLIWKQAYGTGLFELDLTYATMRTSLQETLESAVFKYASGHARHLIQAHAGWQTPRYSMALQALWKQKSDSNTYGIINMRVGMPLIMGQTRINLAVDIRNVFDLAYTEVLDAPMPGRWVLFGAGISW